MSEKENNTPFEQSEFAKTINVYTGEISEASRNNILAKKTYFPKMMIEQKKGDSDANN